MNMKIDLEIKPFDAPNVVFLLPPPAEKRDAFEPCFGTIQLAQVDAATLSELCVRFRAEVFAKAGKEDPRLKPLPVPTVGLAEAKV